MLPFLPLPLGDGWGEGLSDEVSTGSGSDRVSTDPTNPTAQAEHRSLPLPVLTSSPSPHPRPYSQREQGDRL